MDATIVFVHGDRMVNLLVLDHVGSTWPVGSVTLQQEGDAALQGMYAQWMPYQVKQADKAKTAQMAYSGREFIGDDIFMVGDVVQLHSGGPLMTVERLNQTYPTSHEGELVCVWQPDHYGPLNRSTFQTVVLINVTGEEEMDGIVDSGVSHE